MIPFLVLAGLVFVLIYALACWLAKDAPYIGNSKRMREIDKKLRELENWRQ